MEKFNYTAAFTRPYVYKYYNRGCQKYYIDGLFLLRKEFAHSNSRRKIFVISLQSCSKLIVKKFCYTRVMFELAPEP